MGADGGADMGCLHSRKGASNNVYVWQPGQAARHPRHLLRLHFPSGFFNATLQGVGQSLVPFWISCSPTLPHHTPPLHLGDVVHIVTSFPFTPCLPFPPHRLFGCVLPCSPSVQSRADLFELRLRPLHPTVGHRNGPVHRPCQQRHLAVLRKVLPGEQQRLHRWLQRPAHHPVGSAFQAHCTALRPALGAYQHRDFPRQQQKVRAEYVTTALVLVQLVFLVFLRPGRHVILCV